MRIFFITLLQVFLFNSYAQVKKVCITIDDLPTVSYGGGNDIEWKITNGIVNTLKTYDAKAIGYVNESKLYQDGELDSSRVRMLEEWLKAGQELGNHTYRHSSYHRESYQIYTQNILRGEKIIKSLAAQYDQEINFFRHPFLHIGLDQNKADSLKTFLEKNGYTEAPVTIDNDDYLFAVAYARASRSDDSALMHRIAQDYLQYMEEKLIFFEGISVKLYDRPIGQTLLIHANLLNAHYLDELLDIYQKHDYGFVSQAEILTDKAYQQEVTFFGDYGISWIKRWALSAGKPYSIFQDDPQVPQYISN